MDISERVSRRVERNRSDEQVADFEALVPITHPDEPVGRNAVLEQILDVYSPIFEGELPPTMYIYGPKGTGKSAVLTVLFEELSQQVTPVSTDKTGKPMEFVYLDTRSAKTPFTLYHDLLEAIQSDPVPSGGISTEELRNDLRTYVEESTSGVVVCVDHLNEPLTQSLAMVAESLDVEGIRWMGVGRSLDRSMSREFQPETTVEFPAYQRHTLEDILSQRVSRALSNSAWSHEFTQRLVEWADGDAHAALAAATTAVDAAIRDNRRKVSRDDIREAMSSVPKSGVVTGQVVSISKTRQTLLRRLLELSTEERHSISEVASALANTDISLSEETIRRVLYELAEAGILNRTTSSAETTGVGRPATRVAPQFPTAVFRLVYDMDLIPE